MLKKIFKRTLCTVMSLAVCGTVMLSSPISSHAYGNLVARWSFESPLSYTSDSTGNGYNLEASTSINVSSDSIKQTAFMAPNTPYYLSVENTTSDFTPNMFTITAWVKFDQDPTNNSWGQAKILDYTNLTYGIYEGYSLYLVSGGYLQFTVANPAGTKWISVRSPSPLSAYNWHQVAAVYSGGLLKIYVDGVMVNSIANEGKFKLPAGKVNIGSQVRKNGDIFYPYNNAYLDEISFYNDMLSDDEIKRDYDAFITRCVKLDDSVYETRPYSGGWYAYSMEKENTVRLYTYGQLEMVTTTKKSCPQVGLIVTSHNQAEILDITGTVIYRSALKAYSVSTPGISSRLDKYYENIPWDIVSRAAYIRAI